MAAETTESPILGDVKSNLVCRSSSYSKRNSFGIKEGNTFTDTAIDLLVVAGIVSETVYGAVIDEELEECLSNHVANAKCC